MWILVLLNVYMVYYTYVNVNRTYADMPGYTFSCQLYQIYWYFNIRDMASYKEGNCSFILVKN